MLKGRALRARPSLEPAGGSRAVLLQFDLADGHGAAVNTSGDHDSNVFFLLEIGDKLLSLFVAGLIKSHDFFVVSEHPVAAAGAIRHLQAIFAVFCAKAGLLTVFGSTGQVNQVSLNGGISGKRADSHHCK